MTQDSHEIADRLARLHERMAAACARAGREPASVRLIAVSKRHALDAMLALHALGQRDFGENRPQEALEKIPALPTDARVHLIGQLQSNKVNKVVGRVASIQSVDRPDLLERIARRAEQLECTQEILLQVNVTQESQKGGIEPARLPEFWGRALELEAVRPTGLMALGRAGASESETRRDFAALRELAVGLEAATELSMGMSDDFEWAIEEGATQIRVGSVLFGPRPD